MGPWGNFGGPLRLLESYKEWRDLRLEEADSKADFATFLFGPVRQALWHGYQRVQPEYRRYARVENAPDFRERRLRGLTALSGIGYVGDHGEYPPMGRGERPPASLVIDTYGGVYAITRQAIRNDDTGALLNDVPRDMGYAAGIFVVEAIISMIEGNPTAPDGDPFFSGARGNETTLALSEDSLADAISFMEGQVDDSGYQITVRAQTLVVKTARLQGIARRILGSQESGATANYTGAAGAGTNIFDKGTLNPLEGVLPADAVVRDPHFSDPNNWYLFADPDTVPAFAVGFLDGREEPFVGLKNPEVRNALGAGEDPYTYELDSVDFKVRLDFGVAPVDPRGAFRGVVA